MAAAPMIERRHIFFSGRVQGVGFRYAAVRAAQGLAVTGFVRNLPDRRVELVAEGKPADLDRLLAEIQTAMEAYIQRVEAHQEPATGEFAAFEVAY